MSCRSGAACRSLNRIEITPGTSGGGGCFGSFLFASRLPHLPAPSCPAAPASSVAGTAAAGCFSEKQQLQLPQAASVAAAVVGAVGSAPGAVPCFISGADLDVGSASRVPHVSSGPSGPPFFSFAASGLVGSGSAGPKSILAKTTAGLFTLHRQISLRRAGAKQIAEAFSAADACSARQRCSGWMFGALCLHS